MTVDRGNRNALCVLAVVATLTFYPVVKGFTLGQIQTWINLLLSAALWLWLAGRRAQSIPASERIQSGG